MKKTKKFTGRKKISFSPPPQLLTVQTYSKKKLESEAVKFLKDMDINSPFHKILRNGSIIS